MKKSIPDQLAHSLGRKDEAPNIKLAEKIVKENNTEAVKELISLLEVGNAAARSDAIKVLYEAGERNPKIISAHTNVFIQLLHHKDNRMKWGAMSALSAISRADAKKLTSSLPTILNAMDEGSVITRDHGIFILAQVAKLKNHHDDCMTLLLEQLEKAPVNQVPMYAERTREIISKPYVARFKKIIAGREDVLSIESKKKRIEKLMKTLH